MGLACSFLAYPFSGWFTENPKEKRHKEVLYFDTYGTHLKGDPQNIHSHIMLVSLFGFSLVPQVHLSISQPIPHIWQAQLESDTRTLAYEDSWPHGSCKRVHGGEATMVCFCFEAAFWR